MEKMYDCINNSELCSL